MEDEKAILTELRTLLKDGQLRASPQHYCPVLLAYFTTHRTKLRSSSDARSPNVWIDASVFRNGLCYVVGTLDQPDGMTPSSETTAKLLADDLAIATPAPAKVIAYLAKYCPHLLRQDEVAMATSALESYKDACLFDEIPSFLLAAPVAVYTKEDRAWDSSSDGEGDEEESSDDEEEEENSAVKKRIEELVAAINSAVSSK